ncbi:MAG: thiosulfate sulfurtransferase, partial [Deltaproteobacteria bacterium]|nr:thiosulfate sulfurtransferase [Deltaproteobacteria bacterium]
MILTDNEFALIDVREQGEFATSHILTACCVPLSAMEILMPEMVPRQDTTIVLVGDCFSSRYNLLQRAATCLHELGYQDISFLEGGIESWHDTGYLLFSGINTLSKAFGEFVEATYKTPRIDAASLKEKIDLDEKILVFDARPAEEFRRISIPGALNVPGAELLYRFFEIVRDPDIQVVVNCAGRTRSIIGAQSLINAGVPNPVMALENGTMGWHLAGFELYCNQTDVLPVPSEASMSAAIHCTRKVAKRYGVKVVDRNKLLEWQNDTISKNLYLLDVRSPEEFI